MYSLKIFQLSNSKSNKNENVCFLCIGTIDSIQTFPVIKYIYMYLSINYNYNKIDQHYLRHTGL